MDPPRGDLYLLNDMPIVSVARQSLFFEAFHQVVSLEDLAAAAWATTLDVEDPNDLCLLPQSYLEAAAGRIVDALY